MISVKKVNNFNFLASEPKWSERSEAMEVML
jgi:hypothetical protein